MVNFLFETGILAKTQRSGFNFLGSGEQSVAEHTNRTVFIAYALGMLDGTVDIATMLKMALFHDLAEGRVSDLNYVHQRYTDRYEERAMRDLAETLPFGKDMEETFAKFEEKESLEAMYVRDADNLEWILSLKEQIGIGNTRAGEWIGNAVKRLKTEYAKQIAEGILATDSNEWWFGDKNDEWWVSRKRKTDAIA